MPYDFLVKYLCYKNLDSRARGHEFESQSVPLLAKEIVQDAYLSKLDFLLGKSG